MKIYEYKYDDKDIMIIGYKNYRDFKKYTKTFININNIYNNITIKLIRTNDINIQKIIEGLAENQKCFLKYDTKTSSIFSPVSLFIIYPYLIEYPGISSIFSFLFGSNIFSSILKHSFPLILTIPIPPAPVAVDIATIVFILISPF